MAVIETKYSVGDVVYHAGIVTQRKQHDCPDCLGARKWTAKSPAGAEHEIPCPRCTSSFLSDRDLSLDYTAHVPTVQKLTIGSVQHNSVPGHYDSGNRYMCRETGIGSGSIYEEEKLFTSEDGAMAAAKAMADVANTKSDWIVKLYNKTLSISDYQIVDAKLKLADEEKSRVSNMFWNVGYLFNEIKEAADKDAILELIDTYTSFDWKRDADRFREEFCTKAEGSTNA